MNQIVLIGRNVSEGELRYTQSGTAKYENTIAVERAYKNAQGEKVTDFIRYEAWKQLAELCANYTKKGSLIAISGELHIDKVEKDGQTRYYAKVNANNVRFLSPKSQDTHGDGYEQPTGEQVPAEDDVPF